MNSRLPMGVLATGLGAAALIAFGSGPALAGQELRQGQAVSAEPTTRVVPAPDPDRDLAWLLIKSTKLNGLQQLTLLTEALAIDPNVARILDEIKKVKSLEILKSSFPDTPQHATVNTLLADPAYKAGLGKLTKLPRYAEVLDVLKKVVRP